MMPFPKLIWAHMLLCCASLNFRPYSGGVPDCPNLHNLCRFVEKGLLQLSCNTPLPALPLRLDQPAPVQKVTPSLSCNSPRPPSNAPLSLPQLPPNPMGTLGRGRRAPPYLLHSCNGPGWPIVQRTECSCRVTTKFIRIPSHSRNYPSTRQTATSLLRNRRLAPSITRWY